MTKILASHKKLITILFTVFCISFLQTASADFQEAINAYKQRNGEALIIAVKDAVDKKNNDGLLLFLYATGLDTAKSEYDFELGGSNTTLKAILKKPQWNQLRTLLTLATDRESLDIQYYLRSKTQFSSDFKRLALGKEISPIKADAKLSNEDFSTASKKIHSEYIAQGSQYAQYSAPWPLQTPEQHANIGNADAQLNLGFEYMNYGTKPSHNTDYGCKHLSKKTICQHKNEQKGNYWLKRAAENIDTYTLGSLEPLASEMCNFLRSTSNKKTDLEQAYRWALMGINEQSFSSSLICLRKMRTAGKLKKAAPQLDKVWRSPKKRNLIFTEDLHKLPAWITEIRKNLKNKDLPVFRTKGLEVYKDGRVLINLIASFSHLFTGSPNLKIPYMKVSPDKVKRFLADLKALGFYKWNVRDYHPGMCGDMGACHPISMIFVTIDGSDVNRVALSYASVSKLNIETEDSLAINRMAMVYTLIEKYFPRAHLNCILGNSEKLKASCLEGYAAWNRSSKKSSTAK